MPTFFSFLREDGHRTIVNLEFVDVVFVDKDGTCHLCMVSADESDVRYQLSREDFNRFCKLTGV
jgi:hypothetical protein